MKRRFRSCRVVTNGGRKIPGRALGDRFAYKDVEGWTVEQGDPMSLAVERLLGERLSKADAMGMLRQ